MGGGYYEIRTRRNKCVSVAATLVTMAPMFSNGIALTAVTYNLDWKTNAEAGLIFALDTAESALMLRQTARPEVASYTHGIVIDGIISNSGLSRL